MSTYFYIILPLIGFVGMFSGGYWGVGCGWLIVPTMLIFGATPNEAVGVGLLQIVPSTLPSTIKDIKSYGWKTNPVGFKLVVPLAIGAFLLCFSGKFINDFFYVKFGNLALLSFFAIFMLILGSIVIFGKINDNENYIPKITKKDSIIALLFGAGAGVFSSVLGVGGAMFFRPALANYFKIPENISSKSVRILLLVTTLTGGLFYFYNNGNPDYKIIVLSILISLGGMMGFAKGIVVHNIVVANGYAKFVHKSFAIVTFIVLTNTVLNILGYVVLSRYLMIAIALFLFIGINIVKIYTTKHKKIEIKNDFKQ